MSWDAVVALLIVLGAAAVLVRQFRSEQRVCEKCEVVDAHQRRQQAGVVNKPVSALKIGARKS